MTIRKEYKSGVLDNNQNEMIDKIIEMALSNGGTFEDGLSTVLEAAIRIIRANTSVVRIEAAIGDYTVRIEEDKNRAVELVSECAKDGKTNPTKH